MVANELKYKAPKAHTMLELVYVRWGRTAHIIYFFFSVLTNLLVSLSMLQGTHHVRACIILPAPKLTVCPGVFSLPGWVLPQVFFVH